MGKAAQEKVKFRWYDMTRFEVSNKVRGTYSWMSSGLNF